MGRSSRRRGVSTDGSLGRSPTPLLRDPGRGWRAPAGRPRIHVGGRYQADTAAMCVSCQNPPPPPDRHQAGNSRDPGRPSPLPPVGWWAQGVVGGGRVGTPPEGVPLLHGCRQAAVRAAGEIITASPPCHRATRAPYGSCAAPTQGTSSLRKAQMWPAKGMVAMSPACLNGPCSAAWNGRGCGEMQIARSPKRASKPRAGLPRMDASKMRRCAHIHSRGKLDWEHTVARRSLSGTSRSAIRSRELLKGPPHVIDEHK